MSRMCSAVAIPGTGCLPRNASTPCPGIGDIIRGRVLLGELHWSSFASSPQKFSTAEEGEFRSPDVGAFSLGNAPFGISRKPVELVGSQQSGFSLHAGEPLAEGMGVLPAQARGRMVRGRSQALPRIAGQSPAGPALDNVWNARPASRLSVSVPPLPAGCQHPACANASLMSSMCGTACVGVPAAWAGTDGTCQCGKLGRRLFFGGQPEERRFAKGALDRGLFRHRLGRIGLRLGSAPGGDGRGVCRGRDG